MQIKPKQTRRHLGGDRRRLDGEATASMCWSFPDGDVLTSRAVCSVIQCRFECLLNIISGHLKQESIDLVLQKYCCDDVRNDLVLLTVY